MTTAYYDALGNQTRAGMPVATAAGWINRALTWTSGYSSTEYDVLGRPTRTYAPNGERQDIDYVGRASSVVAVGLITADTNRMLKWNETDELGYLKIVRTYNLVSGTWTKDGEVLLTHDVLGNLTKVVHPNSIADATMVYDVGGRKTAMSDPDLGSWSYTYDRQGRLVTQSDACGNGTTLSYNNLDQLTGKSFTDTATCGTPGVPYSISYTYGGSGTATGQLTQIAYSNSSYSKDLTYHTNGLLKDETVKITGGATAGYKTSYGYDSYLRPSTTTYPDNDVVTVSYNSMGLPAKLVSSASGTLVDGLKDVKAFTEAVDYDVAGRIYDMRFPAGGNIWRRQGYHAWNTTHTTYAGNGEGRLWYIHVGTNQGLLDRLNLAYDYDSYGNVERHYDNAGYNSFSYDDQNRLTDAYTKVYDNDTSGRLTSYEGVNQPVSSAFPGHAIKKSGYSYNANGNLITRASKTLNWDVQNRLMEVKNGSTTEESYLYDDSGIRIKKTVGSTNSYYPFAHYEVNGSTIVKYYFFAGMRIATKKGSTLYYLHTDQLGSIVLTNGVNQHQEYCAYGRKRSVSGSTTTCGGSNTLSGTDHTFTGQKIDGTGLMYYQSRYYDPEIGAFISPDTIVPDATNLFAYNRFMYGLGNPIRYA